MHASCFAPKVRWPGGRDIADSTVPEVPGVFLCRDEGQPRSFADMNNTGGPVDVWMVTGVAEDELITLPERFCYRPGTHSRPPPSCLPTPRTGDPGPPPVYRDST